MAPSPSMSPQRASPSLRSGVPGGTRNALPMGACDVGGALPKKGARRGSAENPGLFKAPAQAQVRGMMQTHNPCPLVALIPMLTRRARRLTRSASAAEDLVQDTLLSLCQRLAEGGAIDDLPAYAMRTLSNRARRAWGQATTDELEEDHALTQPDALIRLDCADTLAAIAHLPPPQRALMDLVVAGETSPPALARATGLPLGTVMSRLSRARARLRMLLEEG